MAFFRRLWQRIFLYSIMLVLVVGAMGAYLINKNLTDEAVTVVIAFTSELRKAMTGQSMEEADGLLRRFNNQEARFWLEDAQGTFLGGERFADRSGRDWSGRISRARHAGDVRLWELEQNRPRFLAVTVCELRDGKVLLYAVYMPFPVPPLGTMLSPGIISLLLITGMLALWIAVRVSRPLRRLQQEVSQVSVSPTQLRHVTVAGFDEVADVSQAINCLVDSLQNHIGSMNRLVLNVSHELRSPLTRIGLSVAMIGEGLDLCARCGDGLEERDKAVLRLAQTNFSALRRELEYVDNLIGDTLFASKLAVRERGELTEIVPFSAICTSIAEGFMPVFRQAEVRFILSVDPGIHVLGDTTLLTQVVSNFLDNAGKYATGEEPRIWLRLFRKDGCAILSVENTHSHLPPEVIQHLFDPYFRYEQQTDTGSGLGLPIVREAVLLHGGDVSVENTSQGILFNVSLPLAN